MERQPFNINFPIVDMFNETHLGLYFNNMSNINNISAFNENERLVINNYVTLVLNNQLLSFNDTDNVVKLFQLMDR